MVRKALALLVVVAMVGAVMGAVGLMFPHPADADGHSATRSFGSAEVAAGADLEVMIEVQDFGTAASVVETLPAGFTYKSTNLPAQLADQVVVEGSNVTFTVVGFADPPNPFTYTVTAAGQAGTYDFSGTVDAPLGADCPSTPPCDERPIGGATQVTVTGTAPMPSPSPTPTGPSATRTVAPTTVEPGGEVRVMHLGDGVRPSRRPG